MTTKPVCLLWILGGVAAVANASQISYTVYTGYQPTGGQTGISIQQFDPSMGALQSVDFSLQGYGNVLFTVTNNDSVNPMLYGVTGSLKISLESPNCSPSCNALQDLVISSPSGYYPSTYVGTAGSEATLAPSSSTGQQNLFVATAIINPGALDCTTNASLCAFVTGTGTVLDMVDMADRTFMASNGGSPSLTESATGGGTVTVTYTYGSIISNASSVPEPISMMLFGSGLLGISMRARNRRSLRK